MKKFIWIYIFCTLMFFMSCGYQFEGGGYLKDDVKRVAVRAFENKSSEIGAGITFTNSLIKEIIEKTDTKVVDEAQATAVLKGKINAITFSTLSRSSTESVIERSVSARIDLKLIDEGGKVIWSVKDFSSTEEYTVSQDQITDENNKRDAVQKIADRSAEKVLNKLLINF